MESQFDINEIIFIHPSEHTEGGERFAVEMRLIGEQDG